MERKRHIPLHTKVAGGALATFALVAGACASKAGGPEKNPNPTHEPTATLISELSPESSQSPTPKPEPTVTVEPVLSPEELQDKIKNALGTIPDSVDKDNVNTMVNDGIKFIPEAESDPKRHINAPLNAFGNAGLDLAKLACANPDNEDLAKAWLALRSFVIQFEMKFESQGILPSGSTENDLRFFFQVPVNCPNPTMVVRP
ncbi:hypothetical protein A3A60_02765 [Candidatus Curtissbacteria bacterium RIFCSPLOWO2_01_FULL_42_26]|uniref:Lipoprotein n=1 Tax=Candidatus Curtissbacteria bacterium RIFCSPLOWO2_01_FULL_42_26 TaxID=1797729 RepID=A0A1F5HY36_9BACT|nr:MAG: hypothetical protein A3A60_02765 [Candidatus Curtissbacteria bacterium RIFCSPLOWO2_01_FULL_42_26]